MGEQIKKRRLQLGLSQKTVGEMLGVTSFTVLNWEKGKTQPLAVSIPQITSFLGATTGGSEPAQQKPIVQTKITSTSSGSF